MAIESNRSTGIVAIVVIALAILAAVAWFNQGYGEVSSKTYELSTALYTACMNRSEVHLSKVEELLGTEANESIPSGERQWLQQIIDRARSGDWETAAKSARQIMEDQVDY